MAKKNKNRQTNDDQPQLKRSQLSSAAAELNAVLEPDELIDTSAKIDALKSKVIEAGSLVDPQEDELTDSTWKVLEVLGAAHRPAEEYVPQRGEDQGEQTEPATEATEVSSLTEKIFNTKKLKDLKTIVNENDEFEDLRDGLDEYTGIHGPKKLRQDMYDALGVEPPQPAYKQKQQSEKKQRGPTPFGTSVELMCKKPDQSKDDLIKQLKKKEIDIDNSKSSVQTAYTTVRKVVGLLRDNGHMN